MWCGVHGKQGGHTRLRVCTWAQVTLKDERVIIGEFQCLDTSGNLVLGNTYETVKTTSGKAEERHMGTVLVPKHYQVEVALQVGCHPRGMHACRVPG